MSAFRINPREAITVNQLETFLKSKDELVQISVPLIRRLSPDSLSVMEFKNELVGLKQNREVKKGIMLSQPSFHVEVTSHERDNSCRHAAML